MSYPPQEGYPAPMTQPQAPMAQPPAPVLQPMAPVMQPMAPVMQPMAPVMQPAAPVMQPAAPEPTTAFPTGQYPIQPPAAPGYSPAFAQISGTPYAPPRAKGRFTVLILSIAAALLLVFGGLMLGLYLNERGNLKDTRADLTAQVSAQKTTVAGQQEKLAAEEKQTAELNAQLDKLKTSSANVTKQRDVLAPCMRHFEAMLDATSVSGFDAAYRATKAACDKAERVMDS